MSGMRMSFYLSCAPLTSSVCNNELATIQLTTRESLCRFSVHEKNCFGSVHRRYRNHFCIVLYYFCYLNSMIVAPFTIRCGVRPVSILSSLFSGALLYSDNITLLACSCLGRHKLINVYVFPMASSGISASTPPNVRLHALEGNLLGDCVHIGNDRIIVWPG